MPTFVFLVSAVTIRHELGFRTAQPSSPLRRSMMHRIERRRVFTRATPPHDNTSRSFEEATRIRHGGATRRLSRYVLLKGARSSHWYIPQTASSPRA